MPTLNVSYPLELFCIDSLIDKATRIPCCACGAGFGKRDLHYEFEEMSQAVAAKRRVDAIRIKYIKTNIE